jgi:hypothetical protein
MPANPKPLDYFDLLLLVEMQGEELKYVVFEHDTMKKVAAFATRDDANDYIYGTSFDY